MSYSDKILTDIMIQKKESRASTLEHLPLIYKKQIQKLLSGSENFIMDDIQAAKKREIISDIRKNLHTDINNAQKKIFDCLDDIDSEINKKEEMYYKRKILVGGFFATLKLLFSEWNFLQVPFIRAKVQKNWKYLVDEVDKLSFDEVRELSKFNKDSKDLSNNIENIVKNILVKISYDYINNYSDRINEYTKYQIIDSAKNKYPDIWNNKLMFFDRPKQVQELNKSFYEYLSPILNEYFLDYLSYNIDKYKSISNLFYDLFLSMHFLLQDESIDDIFIKFAQSYIDKLFEKTQERKIWKITKQEKNNSEDIRILNNALKSHVHSKSINPDVLDIIEELSQLAEISSFQENEFKRLFLKRYRNKTQIRIYDLEEKFWINGELISDTMIKKLKKIWFNILKDYKQEHIIQEDPVVHTNKINDDTTDNTAVNISDNDNVPEEIRETKDIIKILEAYGYSISNTKRFEKQFDALYTTHKKKDWLFSILRNNIKRPEKRNILQYWAIDLRYWHRILILNKNEIDWIYNHEEYSNRVKAII